MWDKNDHSWYTWKYSIINMANGLFKDVEMTFKKIDESKWIVKMAS